MVQFCSAHVVRNLSALDTLASFADRRPLNDVRGGWGTSGVELPEVLHSVVIWFHLASQMHGEFQLPVSRTNHYLLSPNPPKDGLGDSP